MTNEEAIKKITHVKYCYAYEGDYEAFDMAIKALSVDIEEDVARRIATIIENEQDMRVILKNADRPTGKWEYNSLSDKWRCNQCFQSNDKKSNFCPDCGARMKGEENGDK